MSILTSNIVRYLELNFNKRHTWNHYTSTNSLILNARMGMFRPILIRNNYTSLKTKLLVYKTLLKPIWTYALQLNILNLNKIQTYQNIVLCRISNAFPYVFNLTLHKNLAMKSVYEGARTHYARFDKILLNHPDPILKDLSTLIAD